MLIQTDFKDAKIDSATGIQLSDVYYKLPSFRGETTGRKIINAAYQKIGSEWKTKMVSRWRGIFTIP